MKITGKGAKVYVDGIALEPLRVDEVVTETVKIKTGCLRMSFPFLRESEECDETRNVTNTYDPALDFGLLEDKANA